MMPPWQLIQLDTPQEVEEFPADRAKTLEHAVIWAWLDEPQGIIRARTFASD